MRLTKSILILATAGFLAACDEVPMGNTGVGTPGPRVAAGVDAAAIRDGGLTGQLDRASVSGDTVSYAYFTDVIGDGRVLTGADAYCGGPGRAIINLDRGDRSGRGYNTMVFTCR